MMIHLQQNEDQRKKKKKKKKKKGVDHEIVCNALQDVTCQGAIRHDISSCFLGH